MHSGFVVLYVSFVLVPGVLSSTSQASKAIMHLHSSTEKRHWTKLKARTLENFNETAGEGERTRMSKHYALRHVATAAPTHTAPTYVTPAPTQKDQEVYRRCLNFHSEHPTCIVAWSGS